MDVWKKPHLNVHQDYVLILKKLNVQLQFVQVISLKNA